MRERRLPPLPTLFAIAWLAIAGVPAAAQQDVAAGTDTGTTPAAIDVSAESQEATRATLQRLSYIESVVARRLAERDALSTRLEMATERETAELVRQVDALNNDIATLRRTLENLATGGVDSSVFERADQKREDGDWREDIALIAQPVIDSLKDITEKPRRIKALNDAIAVRHDELELATRALKELQPELSLVDEPALEASLRRIAERWQKRADDATAAIDIARFQIAGLRGDKPVWRTVWEALVQFATGRGLTLLLAAGGAAAVWFGTRFALSGYRRTLLDKSEPESRTRYRLAVYSLHAFTGLLMLVAVFVVFYQRGDVLLLGLMILLFFGLALGARNLLPRYVNEARLLLNLGPIREGERLLLHGLPWRVESINMYTVLRNPELQGVLRVPLKELEHMMSRPVGREPWFPSSKGDVLLLDGGRPLVEVLEQNPDTVTLRERGGQVHTVPSGAFYNRTMVNLSRNGSFGVRCRFGIDYDQQAEALDEVPRTLRTAVRAALAASDLGGFVEEVEVELSEAGESALQFWLFVTLQARAAKSYWRVQRLMQAACVQACTERGWSIPLPRLSVVRKG